MAFHDFVSVSKRVISKSTFWEKKKNSSSVYLLTWGSRHCIPLFSRAGYSEKGRCIVSVVYHVVSQKSRNAGESYATSKRWTGDGVQIIALVIIVKTLGYSCRTPLLRLCLSCPIKKKKKKEKEVKKAVPENIKLTLPLTTSILSPFHKYTSQTLSTNSFIYKPP